MSSPPKDSPPDNARVRAAIDRYWRMNRLVVVVLLVLWAAVSLGCGVLFADALNQFSIGGCPLGFWFAQQGAILGFVVLIFTYAVLMAQLDRRYRSELAAIQNADMEKPS
jgi:putative solute:sodium symporter small subunit